MGGLELENGTLLVDREPNQLDELAIEFSEILDRFSIEHVFVAGYVAILAGRSRSTEGVDVLIDPIKGETAAVLVDVLEEHGYWGPAMPLTSMYEMLENGDNIWVTPDDRLTPHLAVKNARDRFDRASLENAIAASIGGAEIPIGPFELQIAYKHFLGTQRDLEDAIHLYSVLEESLSVRRLERWVDELDVGDEYERLKRA